MKMFVIRSAAFAFLAVFLASSLSAAQTTSTPEEHSHWAEVTHKLEASPLDETVNQDADAAVHQVMDAKDFHVVLCPAFYKEFSDSSYKYHAQILRLYLLGTTTYQVETGKTDPAGSELFGLHSVLKGYAEILKQNPKAKNKQLDKIASADADGKLPDLLKKQHCG